MFPNPSWLGFGDAELWRRGRQQREELSLVGAGYKAVPFEHAVVINEKNSGVSALLWGSGGFSITDTVGKWSFKAQLAARLSFSLTTCTLRAISISCPAGQV